MTRVRLGRTGLSVCKNGFGALPIQRISHSDAARLLKTAYSRGVDFYDTARSYTDSEEKIGEALSEERAHLVLATKTPSTTADGFWEDLHTSLRLLKTDYIDLYQFHNPAFCPKPGDGTGLYEAMLEAKKQGKIRFIGLTNHRLAVAREAVESGLYDTLQFPFSYLSHEKELSLAALCEARDIGFIAMKALSGGLISSGRAAYAWMLGYPHVLPIWGVQRSEELDEFLDCMDSPPVLDAEMQSVIERDRRELTGSFCRGCGYCMPCPAGIEINWSARMILAIRRSPSAGYFSPEWQEKMSRIENCIHCNHCVEHCPYGLDTPSLLLENYRQYQELLRTGAPV